MARTGKKRAYNRPRRARARYLGSDDNADKHRVLLAGGTTSADVVIHT
ncbi:hypothetical protein EVAR_67005_1, partial [Eumeta japonica]